MTSTASVGFEKELLKRCGTGSYRYYRTQGRIQKAKKAVWRLDGLIALRSKIFTRNSINSLSSHFINILHILILKALEEVFIQYLIKKYFKNDFYSSLAARRVSSPTVSCIKENLSYTYINTPPPPLCNVQIGEVFL